MFRRYFWPVMLPVQLLALQVLACFPHLVERFYSNGFYPVLSSLLRLIFGWVPFSMGDVLYGLAILWIAVRIARRRKAFTWKGSALAVLSGISIFFLAFNLLWGLNYYRVRLPDKIGMNTDYSDEMLLRFTKKLIAQTNGLQVSITADSAQKVIIPYSHRAIFDLNVRGYDKLSKRLDHFHYGEPSNKNSMISLPLTYMGFGGYLNPFTHESQVNSLLPMYSLPMTSAHEMAHQIGYASESEANFVGFLAAMENDDPYVRYSALTTALRYCLANWEARDPALMVELLDRVNHGVRENFRESHDFWERYESFIETGFHLFYDNFLKINSQDEGLESYNRFVDLMLNYDQKYPFTEHGKVEASPF